ncbi:7TM diverse intracellular signaling domain-containing protein [Fibrella sp. WM1]|uniref:sensor histidine kinase n=1 Tax=Fibrella musci TaxID=3242485 RepID=UPI0035213F53
MQSLFTFRKGLILLLISGLWTHQLEAQPVLIIDSSQIHIETGPWAEWLADSSRHLTLHDVTSPAVAQRFRLVNTQYPNAGYTLDDYWVRVRIRVVGPNQKPDEILFLENAFPIATSVDLFVLDSTGRVLETHRSTSCSLGDRREVPHPHFVFTMPVRPGQTLTLYVHSRNEMGLQYLPLTIWREAAFDNYTILLHYGWGIYSGFALLAMLLHLLLYGFTRERRYLLVGLMVASYLLYETSRGVGLGMRYLWPERPWLLSHGINLFFTLWIFAYLYFFNQLFALRQTAPIWHRVFIGLGVLNITLFALSLPDWWLPRAALLVYQGTPIMLTMFALGCYVVWQGQRWAIYYVVGTGALLAGGLLLVLSRSGLLTAMSSNLSAMALSGGTMLEISCFTLGIAAQSRRERHERRVAQTQQREAALLNQQERQQRERQETEARLLARIDERRTVADNLHDNLGSMLFSLQLRLDGLSRQPAISIDDIQSVQYLLLQAHQRFRLIAHNLMPDEFNRQGGLAPALTSFIDELNLVSTTSFGLYVDPKAQLLPPNTQFALYNIAFELLQNVLRHARASQASLQVRCPTSTVVLLKMEDNGIGVTKNKLTDSRAFSTIRRRVEQAVGQFQIGLLSGGGTRVIVELPIGPDSERQS